MFEKRTQQRLLTTCPSDRSPDGPTQLADVRRNVVRQIHVFSPSPHLFVRVEFRSIRWQPFDLHTLRKSCPKALGCRTMNRPAVHDQNNSLLQATQQAFHKQLKIIRNDVVIEDVEVQAQTPTLRGNGNGRDDRKTIPPVPAVMNRRLPFRSPSTSDQRLEHKAAFVRKNDAKPVSACFFSYAANPCSASERWLLRRVPGLGVRASGNSNPYPLARARRRRDRTERRSVCESPGPHALGSTVRWHNRVC